MAKYRFSMASVNCKSIVKYGPNCSDRIAISDLLAFLVSQSGIGHRNFVDSPACASRAHRDLGFESETIAGKLDIFQLFAEERFLTGFHVTQVQVGYDIGN